MGADGGHCGAVTLHSSPSMKSCSSQKGAAGARGSPRSSTTPCQWDATTGTVTPHGQCHPSDPMPGGVPCPHIPDASFSQRCTRPCPHPQGPLGEDERWRQHLCWRCRQLPALPRARRRRINRGSERQGAPGSHHEGPQPALLLRGLAPAPRHCRYSRLAGCGGGTWGYGSPWVIVGAHGAAGSQWGCGCPWG